MNSARFKKTLTGKMCLFKNFMNFFNGPPKPALGDIYIYIHIYIYIYIHVYMYMYIYISGNLH